MADSLINIFSDNHSIPKSKHGLSSRPFTNCENLSNKLTTTENRQVKTAEPNKDLKKSFLSNISVSIQTTPIRPVGSSENLLKSLSRQRVNVYTDPENRSLDDSGVDLDMLEFTKPKNAEDIDIYSLLDGNDFKDIDWNQNELESGCSTPEPKLSHSFSMEMNLSFDDTDFLKGDISFDRCWEVEVPDYE